MKRLALELEIPQNIEIEINGNIFGVLKSDIDILNRSAELELKYAGLKKEDLQSVRDAVNEIVMLIDEILGDGAVKKISGGRPVNIRLAVAWLTEICKAITESGNDEYIAENYE
ncbi:MAG: hypothetical protein FWH10_07225 [Oscillospiraceae bacterium]|nr:hypothetical protein [Oscillospiraceae bacterium]